MFIDIVVAVLLIIAIYKGFTKGLVVGVFSFVAFIIGLAAALKLSAVVASYLGENISVSQKWLPVIAFFLVFFVVVLLVRLGAKAIEGVMRLAMLGWLNRIGGIIFFSLLYLFILSIILFYASNLHLLGEKTIKGSVTYSWLRPMAPGIIEAAGKLLPFLKNMFADLSAFFGSVAESKK
jgi:membrane protein required for colicin V production